MLYSSFLRSVGPGMIWSYGPQAGAIAVGSTGGIPDIPGQPQVPSLGWDELERDLLLAARFCNDLHIHSLEGCVEHGFFERISAIDWDQQAGPPCGEDRTGHPPPPHGRALDDRPPGPDARRRRSLRPFVVTCSPPLSPAATSARIRGTDPAAGSCSGPAAAPAARAWERLSRGQPDPARFDPVMTAGLPEPACGLLVHIRHALQDRLKHRLRRRTRRVLLTSAIPPILAPPSALPVRHQPGISACRRGRAERAGRPAALTPVLQPLVLVYPRRQYRPDRRHRVDGVAVGDNRGARRHAWSSTGRVLAAGQTTGTGRASAHPPLARCARHAA